MQCLRTAGTLHLQYQEPSTGQLDPSAIGRRAITDMYSGKFNPV